MFEKGFKASKCKSLLKLVISRIAMVRNKRGAQIRQMRKDVAQLLQSDMELSARKRVDIVMKEQNILDAYAVLENFCNLVLTQLAAIKANKSCSLDTKEAISSLIFAGSRCADLPELLDLRSIFEEHYGKQFIVAATELQSGSGVNKVIIEKLSVHTANEDLRLQLMKDIAAENRVQWSPKDPDIISHSHVGFKSDQIENEKYSMGLVDKTSYVIKDKQNVEFNIPVASEGEAISPALYAADVEQMQFVPFVSSLSTKSSPPGRSVQEHRQFIPFVQSVSRSSSPSTSSMEAKILDSDKDARNLNSHKTRQSAQGLRTERDKEPLADRFSNHDLSFTQERMPDHPDQDGDMQARCEMHKHADGLACAEEVSPTLPRQNRMEQQHVGKSFESGDGAEADSWMQSDKPTDVSIKATNQRTQKIIVNKIELHPSHPPMTRSKTGSNDRDVKENVDSSSASADVLLTSRSQLELERAEKIFENEFQQRRSKAKVDSNWTSVKETARSSDYEDNSEQNDNRVNIRNEALTRHSKHQEFRTSLQNQTEQPNRIVKHVSAVTSSEIDDDSSLMQRPSTKNTRRTASSDSIDNNQEMSFEDESELDPCVFRKPRLSLHAQESDLTHKGNRSGNARHKCHESQVLQDKSQVHSVYKSGENHLSNEETESNDNDTEDPVFYSLSKGVVHYPKRSKLKEHSERAGKGAYVSGKSVISYCGSDQDPVHWSSSASSPVRKFPVYFDGCHFDENNMHNLGEQNQGMKREHLHVAEKRQLDYGNNLQTQVGIQDTGQQCVGDENFSPYAFDNSPAKDECLQPRSKLPDKSGSGAAANGVSDDRREVVHGKLKWHSSSHEEQEDTSSNSGKICSPNAFDSHCEAEDVQSQNPHSIGQFRLRKMGTATADKQEAVNPSSVRIKRTIGISVRSRIPIKTDESSKPKPVEQEAVIASEQYSTTYPNSKLVQIVSSEPPADVNPGQYPSSKLTSASDLPMSRPSNETKSSLSSEANDVQKAWRDQNSTRTASYLPTSRPCNEADNTAHSGANELQKGLKGPIPSTRAQINKSLDKYASSRQTPASNLPTSQPGLKASEITSAKVSHVQKSVRDSPFSTKNQDAHTHTPSSKLTSASNFPSRHEITKIETEACLSDDDLVTRFQALKAQLYTHL